MANKFEDIQKIIQKRKEGVKLLEEEKDLLIEYTEIQDRLNDSGDKRLKNLVDRVAEADKELKLAEELADMGEKLEGHYDAIYKAEQAQLKLTEERIAQEKLSGKLTGQAYKDALKQLKLDQDSLKARKDAAGYTENLIGRLTGISDKPTSGIAKMFSNPEGFAKGFSDGIGKMITPMNIMTSTVDKVVESTMALAVEQDAAISNFRKATGATGDFDADIVKLERDLFKAGVTSAEAAESVQELYLNVSGFTEMGDTAREEMAGMVAVLAEVGVAASDSTQNIQTAIKGLGMSKTEATMLQSELRSFAQGINVSAGQLAKDFNTMGPQIVAMGDKGVAAFESLQVTMKETGLEMQTMLKLVEQFDTFDGAGKQVGKLNALLGGPFLNTLELVSETDLGARMEKLRDGVLDAGVSFDSLDYYQKKAYTSALGLNSELELAMFLGNNMDQIVPEEKTAEEYEEIAKQTAEFNTVMDEAIQAGKSLAISLRWVVTSLKWFFEIVAEIGPYLTALALTIGIVRTAFHLHLWATNALTAATNAGKAATLSSIVVEKIKLGWMKAYGAAKAWMTGRKIASTAATAAETGAEVANSAQHIISAGTLNIYTIAIAPAVKANTALAVSSTTTGTAMAGVVPVMLAFGAAILMVGLGIGIAAAGMSLFVDSIAGLAGLHGDIFKTALAILAVAAALDDIPLTKTIALSAVILPLAAMAPVAMVAAAGASAVTRGVGGTSSAAASGQAGPPAEIKLYLDVGGDKFAVAVNNVEVGNKVTSKLHQTFVDQLAGALSPAKS